MSEGKKIKINRRNASEDVKVNDQKPEEIEVTQTEDAVVKSIDDIEIPDIEMVENNVKVTKTAIHKVYRYFIYSIFKRPLKSTW